MKGYAALIREIEREMERCEEQAPVATALSRALSAAIWGPGATGISDAKLELALVVVGALPGVEIAWEAIAWIVAREGPLWREAMARERNAEKFGRLPDPFRMDRGVA